MHWPNQAGSQTKVNNLDIIKSETDEITYGEGCKK